MFKKLLSGGNTDKAEIFEKYLNSKNVNYDVNDDDNGAYMFAFNQKLDCGPTVRFLITFNKDRETVTSYLFNYVLIQEISKLSTVHSLINKLNASYIFTIFYEEENEVSLKYAIDIESHFEPDLIMNQCVLMMNVAEKSYPEFMKAIWA